ncbi:unnamed protein product [Phytophthora fragariaefolia]|uniref:Unnamed protein product n=1 Tax=Phytophthora fragariaefolia TaxID=1490495 RepID=A0A9W6YAB2_9STRA|nr:unnamed protein product [Phytophthora fragariaefolia]
MTGVSTAETTGELDERMDVIAELPWRDYGREGYLDSEEESDHDYIDAGLANEKSRSGNSREDSARPQWNSARTQWNSTGSQGNSARQQPSSASHWNPVNPPPDRHSRVGRPSDRQDNYGRRSAEPVTEAKFIFTYVSEAGRPEDERKSDGNGSDMDGIDGELGYSEGESPAMMKVRPPSSYASTRDGGGERPADEDFAGHRGKISAINKARKLRLKRQANRDVQIGVQGIGKDKVGTSTRAWVKVTLGWEVSYEFEVWTMDHHAGVDLILRTDFMIPAGIRLDLYNSLAKLPDEVVVPLIKSQNSADDPRKGLQITDGSTETICLPGRLTAEFRVRRRQPAESTHELWVRL